MAYTSEKVGGSPVNAVQWTGKVKDIADLQGLGAPVSVDSTSGRPVLILDHSSGNQKVVAAGDWVVEFPAEWEVLSDQVFRLNLGYME